MEIWVLTALAAAVLSSAKSTVQKLLTEDYNSVEIGYIAGILGVFFLAPVGVWGYIHGGLPRSVAILGVIGSGLGNVIGVYLYLEALRIEDISVVSPFRRTTPVIVAVLEPLLLGISYSASILVGALFTVMGGYVVMVDGRNFLSPFKRPGRGVMLALSIAFLYAGVAIAERYVLQEMNSLLFTFLVWVVIAAGYSTLMRKNGHVIDRQVFRQPVIVLIGLAASLGSIAIFYSLSLASASQVITVKQSVVIFNVLIGGFLFSEKNIIRKLLGSILILAGIVLVI